MASRPASSTPGPRQAVAEAAAPVGAHTPARCRGKPISTASASRPGRPTLAAQLAARMWASSPLAAVLGITEGATPIGRAFCVYGELESVQVQGFPRLQTYCGGTDLRLVPMCGRSGGRPHNRLGIMFCGRGVSAPRVVFGSSVALPHRQSEIGNRQSEIRTPVDSF